MLVFVAIARNIISETNDNILAFKSLFSFPNDMLMENRSEYIWKSIRYGRRQTARALALVKSFPKIIGISFEAVKNKQTEMTTDANIVSNESAFIDFQIASVLKVA